MLACCPFERGARDARLHGRSQVLGLDCQDPVHPRQVEADAARHRYDVPLQARADAEGSHGDLLRGGELEDADNVLRRRGVDDEIGAVRRVKRHVLAVQIAIGITGRDPGLVPEHLVQCGRQRRHLHGSNPTRTATHRRFPSVCGSDTLPGRRRA